MIGGISVTRTFPSTMISIVFSPSCATEAVDKNDMLINTILTSNTQEIFFMLLLFMELHLAFLNIEYLDHAPHAATKKYRPKIRVGYAIRSFGGKRPYSLQNHGAQL
jgi:hypothetical protein